MVRLCIQLTRLTLVCEVNRTRFVQVRQKSLQFCPKYVGAWPGDDEADRGRRNDEWLSRGRSLDFKNIFFLFIVSFQLERNDMLAQTNKS